MSNRTLITGFGPFGDHKENPSGYLASCFNRDHAVLEVSYHYAYEFWDALVQEGQYDRIICLGLAAKAPRLRLELFARNAVGQMKDVRGETWSTDFIVAEGPPCLGSTIMPPDLIFAASALLDAKTLELSTNPGDYLCNFWYYLLLAGHPGQVGFIHIPPFDVVSAEQQYETIAKLIVSAEAMGSAIAA
jgi:pyrrolidone-carboxylate peptidase